MRSSLEKPFLSICNAPFCFQPTLVPITASRNIFSLGGLFFGLLLATLAIDMLDTFAKGSLYFASVGLEYPITRAVLVLLCIAAMLSPRERVQGAIVLVIFGYQLSLIARFYDVVR